MKILVVRLSAMGDIIHALPAIAGLRASLPDARIDWAIEERWSALLTSRTAGSEQSTALLTPEQPLVNAVHRVHMRRWRKAPLAGSTRNEVRELRNRLLEIGYDCAIDLQGAIRSALLASASGAKVRAGAKHPREFPARWWYNVRAATLARHVIDQAAEAVSAAVSREIHALPAPLPHDAAAENWAESLLKPGSSPFAIVNPGAGWGAKRWPAERYRAVIQALAAHGIHTLVNAGPGERDLAHSVCLGNERSAQIIECSLLQLIAITRRAAVFLGGDTGPLHLASALDVPVVAIFGPTDPARNGPYSGRFAVLRSPESKRDHSRKSAPEAGLLTITADQVTEAALTLLGVPA